MTQKQPYSREEVSATEWSGVVDVFRTIGRVAAVGLIVTVLVAAVVIVRKVAS